MTSTAGSLPKSIDKIIVPPIKSQGIKTKLVPFIASNITWSGAGRWIEPFLGSGVVLFNIQPQHAIVADINPHIITFYQALYNQEFSPEDIRTFLTNEGKKLLASEGSYYYEVRKRFNSEHSPLDFLFLNRAGFNGLIRFNRKGEFNVPFCRKPARFRQSYVTKITNQVARIQKIMSGKDWEFVVADWREILKLTYANDFLYLDPPYVGRHTDYFSQWNKKEAEELASTVQSLPCGYALSMWKENKYRVNEHLSLWSDVEERTFLHYYHIGSTEDLRNAMVEALLIKQGYAADPSEIPAPVHQLALEFSR